MVDRFYVYLHIEPDTDKVFYVGMGKGDRAYRVNSHGSKTYSDRHPEHSEYLFKLLERGYLPHEWINFDLKNVDRDVALKREKQLIKSLSPMFNRKQGPEKSLSKNEAEIISKLYKTKMHSYDDLAFMMDTSRSTIYRIIKETRGPY